MTKDCATLSPTGHAAVHQHPWPPGAGTAAGVSDDRSRAMRMESDSFVQSQEWSHQAKNRVPEQLQPVKATFLRFHLVSQSRLEVEELK